MIERLLAGLIVVGGLVFAAASLHRAGEPPTQEPAPAPVAQPPGPPAQAPADFSTSLPAPPDHSPEKAHAGEHGKWMKKASRGPGSSEHEHDD